MAVHRSADDAVIAAGVCHWVSTATAWQSHGRRGAHRAPASVYCTVDIGAAVVVQVPHKIRIHLIRGFEPHSGEKLPFQWRRRGLRCLDRWCLEHSLNMIVQDGLVFLKKNKVNRVSVILG